MALFYVAGSRFVVRYYLLRRYLMPTVARVAIYGAGEAGAHLSNLLLTTREFDPVIFIDDNKSLRGRLVNGIKVQLPDQLPALIKSHGIDRVLLAVPSLTRRRRREILTQLEPLGVHVQTVPDIEHLVTGKANLADLREVDVCDLLGRDSVPPKPGRCLTHASATRSSWSRAPGGAPLDQNCAGRSLACAQNGSFYSEMSNLPCTTSKESFAA